MLRDLMVRTANSDLTLCRVPLSQRGSEWEAEGQDRTQAAVVLVK